MDAYQHFTLLKRTHRALALKAIIRSTVKPGMKVLDAGCGSGLLSIWAAQAGASEVVGVDLADLTLARALAKENMVDDVVRFVQGDVRNVGIETASPFDVLLAMVYMNDPRRDEDRAALVHGLKKYLVPGAIMVPDKMVYKARACDWPSQRFSDSIGHLNQDISELEQAFGIGMRSFMEALSHKPSRAMFPVRNSDGSLTRPDSTNLSDNILFHVEDYHDEKRPYPARLKIAITQDGEFNAVIWTQELLFDGTLIFSNESVSWMEPSLRVSPGMSLHITLDDRWRNDNLLSAS